MRTSVWEDISSERMEGVQGTPFTFFPSRETRGRFNGPWVQVSGSELPALIDRAAGPSGTIMEVTDDPTGDLRVIAPSLKALERTFARIDPSSTYHVREVPGAGREAYAVFCKDDRPHYLGALEMVELPSSTWTAGADIPLAGEGEVFLCPCATIPFDRTRSMISLSFDDLMDRGPGVHTYRWLVDDPSGTMHCRQAVGGPSPYVAALSSMTGVDMISLHWDLVRGSPFDRTAIPPGERIRAAFMGTLPGRFHDGFLVGSRSVEMALSMLTSIDGDDPSGQLTKLYRLCRGIPDDRALFRMIDMDILDPFYLQKLFKMNKAVHKLDGVRLDPVFPDTQSVHLVATARRRGLSTLEICDLSGLDHQELAGLEDMFGIVPKVERGSAAKGDLPVPLVLTYPEASDVLSRGYSGLNEGPSRGSVNTTYSMAEMFLCRDRDAILFSHVEEETVKRTIRE